MVVLSDGTWSESSSPATGLWLAWTALRGTNCCAFFPELARGAALSRRPPDAAEV